MACNTVMALMKDSLLRTSCGLTLFSAHRTAIPPVSSAIRILAAETAAALAPFKGISPRAARMHAIVLAVPITPQVPAWAFVSNAVSCQKVSESYRRRQLLIDSRDLLNIDRARTELGPIIPTVSASAYSRTLVRARHHWTSDQLNDRLVSRYAAHELSRCGLIATCQNVSYGRCSRRIERKYQPPINTTESTGCALTISSVSILIRFRRYMLVGLEKLS